MNLKKLNISEIGNYVILDQIHPERMSKTYIVKHKFSEEKFILKIVFPKDDSEITKLEKVFRRLTIGIRKLHNPNLIKLEEYFVSEVKDKKCFVLISEFFPGSELDGFLSSTDKVLDHDKLLNCFLSIASAVEGAHTVKYLDDHGLEIEGFPHGDITPRNIMINEKLEMKLLDFKISNQFTISEEKSAYDKKTVVVPEQKNSHIITKSADIFQLGYLLNFLFAKDENYTEWRLEDKSIDQIQSNLDPTKTAKNANKIAATIFKATRSQPQKRYANVKALQQDLLVGKKKAGSSSLQINKWILAACAALLIGFGGIFMKSFFTNSVPSDTPIERGLKPTGTTSTKSATTIGEFYALIIGNEDYRHLQKLSKPIRDANKLKDILTTKYNFNESNVIVKHNASRDNMYDGLEEITSRLSANDNLLIFYAGHGQVDDDEGYWIPVDGRDNSRRDWLSNSEIKHFLHKLDAQNVLLISDACFGGSILRDINSYVGEAKISNKKSRIALTSGSIETVPDKSVFIDQLFWYLENNQDSLVYVSDIFAGIREGIVSNTETDPGYGPIRDAGHQGGDFFFINSNLEDKNQEQ